MMVGTQVAEVLRAHLRLTSRQRQERVNELLAEVGFEALAIAAPTLTNSAADNASGL